MKILLDECVTKRVKRHLTGHEVFTVTEMDWNGLKNGELLSKCAQNAFDILLTIDKNISTQQNIPKYPLIVVVLHTVSRANALKVSHHDFNCLASPKD